MSAATGNTNCRAEAVQLYRPPLEGRSRKLIGGHQAAGPMVFSADLSNITSGADRFEAEAMPCLNNIFRAALRTVGKCARAEDAFRKAILKRGNRFTILSREPIAAPGCSRFSFIGVSHDRRKRLSYPCAACVRELSDDASTSAPIRAASSFICLLI